MIKKFFLTKLLIVLLVFSFSAKAATYWNVAALIWTGTAIVVTAAAIAGAAPIVVAGTLAVGFHAGVIGIYWDDVNPPLNSSSQPTPKGVSVIIDSKTPLVTPANWTAGTAANNYEPVPPGSIAPLNANALVTATYDGVLCPSGFYRSSAYTTCIKPSAPLVNTDDDLKAFALTYSNCQSPKVCYDFAYSDGVVTGAAVGAVRNVTVSYHPTATSTTVNKFSTFAYSICTLGYSLAVNGSNYAWPASCVIKDVTVAPKPTDDVCEMQLRAGKFVKALNDPDCARNLVTGDQSNTVAAVTPSKAIYLVTSTTGDVTVYEKRFDEATNKTITNVGNFGNDGNLNYLQTVNAIGNSVSVNPVTGQIGNVAGSGGSGSGGSSDAKDASLNVVAGGDDDIGNGTSDTGGVTAASNGLSTTLNPLKTWALPSHTGTCPTGSFDALGQTYNFDKFCELMNQYMPTVRSAMGVVYTLAAFFIILGA